MVKSRGGNKEEEKTTREEDDYKGLEGSCAHPHLAIFWLHHRATSKAGRYGEEPITRTSFQEDTPREHTDT